MPESFYVFAEFSEVHAPDGFAAFVLQPPFVMMHGAIHSEIGSRLSELQADPEFQREVSAAVKEVLVPLMKKKLADVLAKVE
jgi:hypothetical protein